MNVNLALLQDIGTSSSIVRQTPAKCDGVNACRRRPPLAAGGLPAYGRPFGVTERGLSRNPGELKKCDISVVHGVRTIIYVPTTDKGQISETDCLSDVGRQVTTTNHYTHGVEVYLEDVIYAMGGRQHLRVAD